MKLYPSMTLANDVMFEFNIEILSVLESAIVETRNADEADHQLLSMLTKTKDNWRRTINLYRLYLINRIGSLYESDLPLQVTGIINSYNSYFSLVEKMSRYASDIEIGLETSEVIPTLVQQSKEWYSRFDDVLKMNLKNNWRGDISILTERIYPNILNIFSLINAFDAKLVESSVSDLNEQELIFSENSQALWSLVSLLLVVIAISYYILNRSILNPLLELSKYFRDDKEKDFAPHKIHSNNMEMHNFVQALGYMRRQVNTQQTELEQMAMHDPLTGLPNRFYLSKVINDHIVNGQRNTIKFAVFLLDLNNFKKINDSLGHNIGDEALCDVANRLVNSIRRSDFLARLGGDEFAMIVVDASELKLNIIAEQIHRSLKPDYKIGNKKFNIGVSIGVAIYPDHAKSEKELIKCADIAMYRAKRTKAEYNLYRSFEAGKATKIESHFELESD